MSHNCVFCLEGGDKNRPILHNVKCRCNYCFHIDCYERYDKKTICPLCRGAVGDLYNPPDVYEEPTYQQPHYIQQSITIASLPTPSAPPIHIVTQPTIIQRRRQHIAAVICVILLMIIVIVVIRELFVSG